MNKTLSFRWVEAASAKSGARLLLVQDGKAFGADVLPKADQAALASWLSASSFEGAAASVAWPAGLTTPVLLAGIGSRPDMHPLRWRRAWAAAARSLSTSGLKKLHFAWPAKTGLPPEPSSWMKLAAESLHYGMYSFDAYKKAVGKIGAFVMEWEGPVLAEKPVRDAIRQGETLGRLLNEMRDAANEPANRFGPVELAARAEKWARETGLSCRVWDEAALKKAKCGALLAVAQGSKRPARLIRFAYTPQGRNAPKPVVLVGKAVTFDSGGISLKPGKGMEWMKYDKCGGITALAVVRQAARLKLPRPVVAYVPAVENMPDGGAVRPGDIVTARNGKTVEILNTDAEGR
ncbi:MAG: leucyl aminopeptidase, partial [Verrucomicrobiota bacterium]|nr:leucyl aminopeptidase [Verrucomicrobiota bacterium]